MMKTKTMLTVLAGAAIGVTVIVVSCGGGGGGGGGGPSTTATGNVSNATAFLRPAFPKRTLLAKWKDMLFATAYAQAAGVDVCAQGNDSLCTTTDGAGNFSLDLGDLSGDICFDFSSGGSLLGTICVPNVSEGATITMTNVDCAAGACSANAVEVRDDDATPSPTVTPGEDDSVDDGVSEPDDDVSGVSENDDDSSGSSDSSGSGDSEDGPEDS
jgi:hypothetical protein